VVFLESNLGFRDSEPGQVEAATDPWRRTLHHWLPLTMASGNWIDLLWKSQVYVPPNLWHPDLPWADWQAQEEAKPHVEAYSAPLRDWDYWYVDDHLKHMAGFIAGLESRGTKVIFFQSPM